MAYDNSTLIITLALATLFIAVAIAIYQRVRVEKAKRTNEHSSLAEDPRFNVEGKASGPRR